MVDSVNWSLVREIGIRHARVSDERQSAPLLAPSFVEQDTDGSYLIVDELGIEKSVPFRFECRTLRVRRDHSIIYDTLARGIGDGCGCLVQDGCAAILRRTTWEIVIVSPEGAVCDRIELCRCSKRMPRFLSWTQRNTFLVVFLDRSGLLDLVEIDRDGRLLWVLPSSGFKLGVPKSVQLLPSGNILVADEFRHVCLELDRRGVIVWQFGECGDPADRMDRLSNPKSARLLPDGTRLIADGRNHRILDVGEDGATSVRPTRTPLCDPSYADLLSNGHCLVCDTGNRRVVEIDEQGNTVWQYGDRTESERAFSFPRSVELSKTGSYLVADTAHNRVVRVVDGTITEWPIHDERALFWPRCARMLSTGALLIADARNSRILEVAPTGRVLNELCHNHVDGPQPMRDPHDVQMLATGHLLITDSSSDLVIETDWNGRVYRLIGTDARVTLKDPHSAQVLDDGRTLICDTGHNRIVFVDQSGECVQELVAIHTDSRWLRLSGPRHAAVSADGYLVIADTGNNRILACTIDGALVWELCRVPQSPIPWLHQPRWAYLCSRDDVIVCDHFNHRIVHMKRGPADP